MSFAQEMKDFVGGWTAVREMGLKKDGLDLQKQQIEDLKEYRDASLEMDKDRMAQQDRQFGMSHSLSAERLAIAKDAAANADAAASANAVYEGLGDVDSYAPEETAIPDPSADAAASDELSLDGYARGGMVRRMAEGGILEEDPDMPFVDPNKPYVDPALNVPVPTPRPSAIPDGAAAAAPQAPVEEAKPNSEAANATVSGAQEATAAVAPQLVADAGAKTAAVGPESEEKQDILNNTGGLSTKEWQELVQTIDPNGSIPDYLKSAAVLSSTYKYFMEKGQPEKAARVAKGILIANKQMTQTLGALAQNAMDDGDMESAAKLVSDAANSFPTGHQFSVQSGENGLTYSVKEDGKVVDQGKLSTDQFWQLAGKVKDGSMYIEEMGRFAENYSSKNTMTPEKALDVVSSSYVAASNAKQAYDDAEMNGVEGKELEALRTAAAAAVKSYKQDRTQAMKMGAKRTDIDASNKDALAMAIPDGQAPSGAAAEAGGGFLDTAGNMARKYSNPIVGLASDVMSGYNYLTGGEESETPAPKDEAEFNALPSGTRFIAPDGTVRTKP